MHMHEDKTCKVHHACALHQFRVKHLCIVVFCFVIDQGKLSRYISYIISNYMRWYCQCIFLLVIMHIPVLICSCSLKPLQQCRDVTSNLSCQHLLGVILAELLNHADRAIEFLSHLHVLVRKNIVIKIRQQGTKVLLEVLQSITRHRPAQKSTMYRCLSMFSCIRPCASADTQYNTTKHYTVDSKLFSMRVANKLSAVNILTLLVCKESGAQGHVTLQENIKHTGSCNSWGMRRTFTLVTLLLTTTCCHEWLQQLASAASPSTALYPFPTMTHH